MFGGLARSEVRLIAALTLAFVGGGIFTNWLGKPQDAPPRSAPAGVIPISGRRLVIPETGGADPSRPVDGMIDLNEATADQLAELPTIGPAKARAIVEHREKVGGFAAVEELDAVPGIGAKTLERLAPFLLISTPAEGRRPGVVEAPAAKPAAPPKPADPPAAGIVRINSATREELLSLDGVGERLADRIIEDRVTRGPFRSVEDLARVRGVGPSILARNRQRLMLD